LKVPTIPARCVPVVPGGEVRALDGMLLGDCGALLLALGEDGL